MYRNLLQFLLILLILVSGQILALESEKPEDRPRIIVLTDISNEPDDEESMVRFLVYSNEFDIEGLIATTSTWLRNEVRPDLIKKQIRVYDKVRKNLIKHAPHYPTVENLLNVVKEGRPEFGMKGVGEGKSSEGSQHIISVVDKPDDRPVWVMVWGGPNCLAQALWDVKRNRSKTELFTFVSKLRVYTISDQDNSGHWLRQTFPDLFYIVSPSIVESPEYFRSTWSGISGDRHYKNGPMENFELVDNPWLIENVIKGHGPLGELYPKVAYIMEGDTPSFLNLINNGLASHISPTYGGWGGRYVLRHSYGESRPIYTNSRDTVTLTDGNIHTSDQATIWRWREAYQYDFAARMDWCVSSSRKEANHNPVMVLNGDRSKRPIHLTVKAGEKVYLQVEGSKDPDDDKISFLWFQYREAGSYRGSIELIQDSPQSISFITPQVRKQETIHIILQGKDNGSPPLFSYRRAIITVLP